MSKINNMGKSGLTTLVTLIKTALGGKVDKADGKVLSTNDFTNEEKAKLTGIAEGANKTVIVDGLTSADAASALSANQGKVLDEKIAAIHTTTADVPTKVSELTNDSGFQTADQVTAAVNAKLSSTYKAAGSIAFANLPTPDEAHLGMVYNVTDAFTATDAFAEGAGKTYPAGTNVVIAAALEGEAYPHVDSNDIMVSRDGRRVMGNLGMSGTGYVLINPSPDPDGSRPYRVCETSMVDAAIASNPDFNYNSIPSDWSTESGYIQNNELLRDLCYGDPVYGYDVLSGFVDLSGYVASGDLQEMTAEEVTNLWNGVTV